MGVVPSPPGSGQQWSLRAPLAVSRAQCQHCCQRQALTMTPVLVWVAAMPSVRQRSRRTGPQMPPRGWCEKDACDRPAGEWNMADSHDRDGKARYDRADPSAHTRRTMVLAIRTDRESGGARLRSGRTHDLTAICCCGSNHGIIAGSATSAVAWFQPGDGAAAVQAGSDKDVSVQRSQVSAAKSLSSPASPVLSAQQDCPGASRPQRPPVCSMHSEKPRLPRPDAWTPIAKTIDNQARNRRAGRITRSLCASASVERHRWQSPHAPRPASAHQRCGSRPFYLRRGR